MTEPMMMKVREVAEFSIIKNRSGEVGLLSARGGYILMPESGDDVILTGTELVEVIMTPFSPMYDQLKKYVAENKEKETVVTA